MVWHQGGIASFAGQASGLQPKRQALAQQLDRYFNRTADGNADDPDGGYSPVAIIMADIHRCSPQHYFVKSLALHRLSFLYDTIMTLGHLDAKSDLFEACLQFCLLDIADIHYSNGIPTWLIGLKIFNQSQGMGLYLSSGLHIPGARMAFGVSNQPIAPLW